MDDFRVSRLEKTNFYVLFFNCKTNTFTLNDLHGSRLDFFLTNKDGRLTCKSSRLKINCKTNLNGRLPRSLPDDLSGSRMRQCLINFHFF